MDANNNIKSKIPLVRKAIIGKSFTTFKYRKYEGSLTLRINFTPVSVKVVVNKFHCEIHIHCNVVKTEYREGEHWVPVSNYEAARLYGITSSINQFLEQLIYVYLGVTSEDNAIYAFPNFGDTNEQGVVKGMLREAFRKR